MSETKASDLQAFRNGHFSGSNSPKLHLVFALGYVSTSAIFYLLIARAGNRLHRSLKAGFVCVCIFMLVRTVDVKVDILILSFGEIREANMVSRFLLMVMYKKPMNNILGRRDFFN